MQTNSIVIILFEHYKNKILIKMRIDIILLYFYQTGWYQWLNEKYTNFQDELYLVYNNNFFTLAFFSTNNFLLTYVLCGTQLNNLNAEFVNQPC